MKKFLCLILVLGLLAVPVLGSSTLVNDSEGLLTVEETIWLEQCYAAHAEKYGYTPSLVTMPSFDGKSAESYAGNYYDTYGYPYDGILLLVSLSEGQWYILTNGACYDRISNDEVQGIGEAIVPYLRDGAYYEAFVRFAELSAEAYHNSNTSDSKSIGKNYGKTIGISMTVGMLLGLIATGIMAAQMKTVRNQSGASDYIRSGSMHLTNSRDIFLYSHVHRTPKPKSNSSGGSSHGGSRGGAGGRI